jgi:hypothetical protein
MNSEIKNHRLKRYKEDKMANKIGEAIVSFGKYVGKDGKQHAKYRKIGDILRHSDGRLYIEADRAFNPGAIPAREGSDRFFIGLNISGVKLVPERCEPGFED